MIQKETLKIEIDELEKIATIFFNRPGNLNAFSIQLVSEFCSTLRELSKLKTIRCLIISGKGKAFSVGGDITEFKTAKDIEAHMANMANKLHEGIHLIKDFKAPIIAAINGACFGAALGYVCSCDLRISTANATFGAAFTGIGLSPDSSTSFHLPRIVGLSLASEMILLNRILSAEEANKFGLVSHIIESGDSFLEEIKKVAVKLSNGAPIALNNSRRLLSKSFSNNLEMHLKEEGRNLRKTAGTEDFKEGINAFLAKEQPKFKGK